MKTFGEYVTSRRGRSRRASASRSLERRREEVGRRHDRELTQGRPGGAPARPGKPAIRPATDVPTSLRERLCRLEPRWAPTSLDEAGTGAAHRQRDGGGRRRVANGKNGNHRAGGGTDDEGILDRGRAGLRGVAGVGSLRR